ncbi:DUF4019 domain-containing protein [Luteimonas mephitis]|uniref:DUF4019 domain-containing protein n=1 Tax=Luteimonas mephitis TaxID=83615 RepID=UPI00040A550D|nr:DUF4019 domain-containing protein [Luteimonas mephitis]
MQGAACAADAVHVDDHGGGRYTLTTTLSGTTDPAHGQLAIVPTAEALCGELHPHYGHYRFESSAPSTATGATGPVSLDYEQDIACRDQPQQAVETASAAVPPAPSTPPTDEDATLIGERTLAYLRAKDAADAGTVYAMLSREMASYASAEAWKETRSALNARLGPGGKAAIVRITWYDDPQNAPTHGRFAAADYRVDYPSEAFTCGYVVWLRQSDGGYLVVRDEEGQATPDVIAGLSPEQRLALRAQLQCRD